jgi:hypothetical protein
MRAADKAMRAAGTRSEMEKALPYREHRGTENPENELFTSERFVPLCALYGNAFSFCT